MDTCKPHEDNDTWSSPTWRKRKYNHCITLYTHTLTHTHTHTHTQFQHASLAQQNLIIACCCGFNITWGVILHCRVDSCKPNLVTLTNQIYATLCSTRTTHTHHDSVTICCKHNSTYHITNSINDIGNHIISSSMTISNTKLHIRVTPTTTTNTNCTHTRSHSIFFNQIYSNPPKGGIPNETWKTFV